MIDICNIKAVMYTEKSISQKENGVLVIQTSSGVTKNQIKDLFLKYFGFKPISINSLNQQGKRKRFRNVKGKRSDFKKFYLKVPVGANIESLQV